MFDYKFEPLFKEPFIGKIDKFDQDEVDRFIDNDKHYTFDEYSYYIVGETVFKIALQRKRDYFSNQPVKVGDVKYESKVFQK